MMKAEDSAQEKGKMEDLKPGCVPVYDGVFLSSIEVPPTNGGEAMLGEVSAEDIAAVGEAAIEATNGGADDASFKADDVASNDFVFECSEDAEVTQVIPNNKDATELLVAEVLMPLGDEVFSNFGSKYLDYSLGVIGNCIGSVDLKLKHSLVDVPNHSGHFGVKSDPAHQVLDRMSDPYLPISGIDIAGCPGDSMVGKYRIQYGELGKPFAHLDEDPVKEKPVITSVLASAEAEGSKVPQTVASKVPQSWAKIVANGKGNAASKASGSLPRLNLRSGTKLEFFEPSSPGFIVIDDDMIDEQPWGSCLVGDAMSHQDFDKSQEEDSGSSNASKWIKVRKRRIGKKGKRQLKNQEKNTLVKVDVGSQGPQLETRVARYEVKEDKFYVPVVVQPATHQCRRALS
ncbi:hypothetical protein U1Q18_017932, partial [Sarracenia purpurea var. burkii]